MVRTRDRSLVAGLVALAGLLAANAVLGPLVTGVIDYHYTESMTNQGMGLDAVALFVVAPAALFAAWLVRKDHLAGPPVAFLPAVFAAYNAGPHQVEQWRTFPEFEADGELFTERIPFRETRDYVKKLTRNRALYEGLYGEADEAD